MGLLFASLWLLVVPVVMTVLDYPPAYWFWSEEKRERAARPAKKRA